LRSGRGRRGGAFAWGRAACSDLACGDPEPAIAKFERALRLRPADPFRNNFTAGIARAHFNAGRYDDAIAVSARVLSEQPGALISHRLRIAAYSMARRTDQARRVLADLLAVEPDMRLSKVVGVEENWRRPDDYMRWFDGLRLAGMPE
jgi:tetratricopeptide (TPR) repeat protein